MSTIYPESYGKVFMTGGGSNRKNDKLYPIMKANNWSGGGAASIGSKRMTVVVPYVDVAKAKAIGLSLDTRQQKRNKEFFQLFDMMSAEKLESDADCKENFMYQLGFGFGSVQAIFDETSSELVFICNSSDTQDGEYIRLLEESPFILAKTQNLASRFLRWLEYRKKVYECWLTDSIYEG